MKDDMTLSKAKTNIRNSLNVLAENFVFIGYNLKYVRDNKLFLEDGYKDINEFAQAEFAMSTSNVSRYMSINDRFSINGNSPELMENYKKFKVSQLTEMINMTEDQIALVTEKTTVKNIRIIKRPLKAVATSQHEPISEKVEPAQPELLSIMGLPKTIYPPDSLLATVGCGHKYDCFSCHREGCGIRQEDCWCVEAPCGDPFPCEILKGNIADIKETIGDGCQFINLNLVDPERIRAGDKEPVPCCKYCSNQCEYVCKRAKQLLKHDAKTQELSIDFTRSIDSLAKDFEAQGSCPPSQGFCHRNGEEGEAGKKVCTKCWKEWLSREKIRAEAIVREKVQTPEEQKPGESHDEVWFVKQYFDRLPKDRDALIKICKASKTIEEAARQFEQYANRNPMIGGHDLDYHIIFYSFSNGIDFRFGKERFHLRYERMIENAQIIYGIIFAEKAHDEAWFVKRYFDHSPSDLKKLVSAYRSAGDNPGLMAKTFQENISKYGAYYRGGSGGTFSFHSFADGIDLEIASEKIHMKYGRFVKEALDIYKDILVDDGLKSDDTSVIANDASEVVDNQHETVNDVEESIVETLEVVTGYEEEVDESYNFAGIPRASDRLVTILAKLFVEKKAKQIIYGRHTLMTPTDDDIMNMFKNHCRYENMSIDNGVEVSAAAEIIEFSRGGEDLGICLYQKFANHVRKQLDELSNNQLTDAHEHDHGAVTTDTGNATEQVEIVKADIITTETTREYDYKKVAKYGLTDVKLAIMNHQKNLLAYKEAELDAPIVKREKMELDALEVLEETLYMHDMPKLDEIKSKPVQPELPVLKNNDQRKAFIEAYRTWPVWIDLEQTGERYYRYNLSDQVAIVVKVSRKHTWKSYKETKDYEYGAEQYYLIGIKSKWTQKGSEFVVDPSRTFHECNTNKSALIEYLKEFQKKK